MWSAEDRKQLSSWPNDVNSGIMGNRVGLPVGLRLNVHADAKGFEPRLHILPWTRDPLKTRVKIFEILGNTGRIIPLGIHTDENHLWGFDVRGGPIPVDTGQQVQCDRTYIGAVSEAEEEQAELSG